MSQKLNWSKDRARQHLIDNIIQQPTNVVLDDCPIVDRVMGRLMRFIYAGRIPPGKLAFANGLCQAHRQRRMTHKQYECARKLCRDHGGENKWRTIGQRRKQQQQHIG